MTGTTIALADLRGAPGTRLPWGSKFFHFHAVFGKNLQNNPNLGVGAPPWEKSWISHCIDPGGGQETMKAMVQLKWSSKVAAQNLFMLVCT